jgi:hypothetical protein
VPVPVLHRFRHAHEHARHPDELGLVAASACLAPFACVDSTGEQPSAVRCLPQAVTAMLEHRQFLGHLEHFAFAFRRDFPGHPRQGDLTRRRERAQIHDQQRLAGLQNLLSLTERVHRGVPGELGDQVPLDG